MVFVKQALPERQLKSTRGFILPAAKNLPHKQKKLNEPEIPLEKIKKTPDPAQRINRKQCSEKAFNRAQPSYAGCL